MQAGKLRHRVQIQQHVQGYDEAGQPIQEWQTVANVWAAVEPLRGRELLAAMALTNETTTRIRIRYHPGITGAMRVLFDGTAYNITSVIEVETRRREIQLICTSV